MSYAPDHEMYQDRDVFAIDAVASERAAFIRRTYAHLFAAVCAFACLAGFFVNTEFIRDAMLHLMGISWLLVLGGFMVVSWIASSMAHSGASRTTQYLGLILYSAAQALIFTPLLAYAVIRTGDASIIMQAGATTLLIFGGLTAVVMFTGADFSFLRTALWLGAIAAFGLIIVATFTGFSLGLWFIVGMVVLMCGYILYDTSNVLHHFRTDQHVAAALALFASLATLFWYVLQLFLSRD